MTARLRAPIAALGAAALSLSLAGPAYANTVVADASSVVADADTLTSPPPSRITLEVISVNGSGCAAGTTRVTTQPDNTGFRVRYTDFIAKDGGNAKPTDVRKNCQINVLVYIPQGYTVAVARADYRGRLHLEPGASALERTNYYVMGSSDNDYRDHPFSGPSDGTWHTTDSTAPGDLYFSPCGQDINVNLNTELRVDAGSRYGATSYMSMRTSDADVDTILRFDWRTC